MCPSKIPDQDAGPPQVDVSEGDDAFGVGEHGGGDDEVSQGVGNDSVLNLEDLLGDSDDDLF